MQPNLRARTNEWNSARRWLGAWVLVALCALTGCVTTDAETGRPIPRGNQKLPFAEVEQAAQHLKLGMNKTQVLTLLGSPAEKDADDDVWIYLPERYAILVPAQALRLEFKDRLLVDHGYRPIVLGAQF